MPIPTAHEELTMYASTVRLFTGSELSETGVSGIPTMLVIAGIALLLGFGAVWLARRRR